MPLSAPFPYYGGKRHWALQVWERFGKPVTYCEPFAGSLAVLLANDQPARREIVCDLNGFVANFWRAVRSDPETVAYYADYPTFHQDLTARHKWLKANMAEHVERLSEDPAYYDPLVAGWWVWGMALWIGGGWCAMNWDGRPVAPTYDGFGRGVSRQGERGDKRPRSPVSGFGSGVSRQVNEDRRPQASSMGGHGRGVSRQTAEKGDKRPNVCDTDGGRGVSRQNDQVPKVHTEPGGHGISRQRATAEKVPKVAHKPGGSGVDRQRENIPLVNDVAGARGVSRQQLREIPDLVNGARLYPKFYAIMQRTANVVVLNRDWTSALSPTMLGDTPSHPSESVAVFMDPPYLSERRHTEIYSTDGDLERNDRVALDSFLWSVKHGDRYRIAYCCHDGDFPIPSGWDVIRRSFRGIRNQERRQVQGDMVMFSPACTVQLDLLGV